MNDNGTHNGSDPILVRVARESPIEELVSRVLGIRHEAGARPEQERLQAIGNANSLAELVAEMREPSVVAGFAISLGDRGEHNLAEHTLDVASDSRQPRDLARLAACLSRSDLPDRGNPRGTLLSAMIRRRLPRDVADVLRELNDAEQTEMVAKVLAGLVQAQRVQDTIYIVHDLRMCQCNSLARELSRSMAVQLDPPGVADFVLGLRIHEDHTSASDAVDAALGREVGEVADLIRQFFESDRRYADEVLDEAVKRLLPANKLVLASLLQEGLPPAIASEVASAIWSKATLALGLEDNTFVDALGTLAERAGLAGVHRALEEATRAHSIERIAELVKQVHLKNIDRAVDTVFATAVRPCPKSQIQRVPRNR